MLLLSTDTLKGYGLNRIFEIAKEVGFDGIDLAIDPKNYDTQNISYLKKLKEQHGLPIFAIQLPWQTSKTWVENAVTMARELDVKIIIVHPPRLFSQRYASWLKNEAPKIRKHENISIALENAPVETFLGIIPQRRMNSLADLKEFKHVALDTSVISMRKEDLMYIYHALRKYLVHIHLSNAKRGKYYLLPDKGDLPLESLLTQLREEDFRGAISLKIRPINIDVGKDEKMIENLKKGKEFYDKYFKV